MTALNSTYNLTALQDAETMYDVVAFADSVTQNKLLVMFIIAIFFIIFFSLLARAEMSEAFTAASFICFILSMMLRFIELLDSIVWMLVFLLFTAIGVLWLKLSKL